MHQCNNNQAAKTYVLDAAVCCCMLHSQVHQCNIIQLQGLMCLMLLYADEAQGGVPHDQLCCRRSERRRPLPPLTHIWEAVLPWDNCCAGFANEGLWLWRYCGRILCLQSLQGALPEELSMRHCQAAPCCAISRASHPCRHS